MIKTDLEIECGYCHLNQVILKWKQYLKQYRGMCPNEACEIWTVVTEVKSTSPNSKSVVGK